MTHSQRALQELDAEATRRGVTLSAVADALGVSRSTPVRWRQGGGMRLEHYMQFRTHLQSLPMPAPAAEDMLA